MLLDKITWQASGDFTLENVVETVPTEITESVNNNEGFYIARFEAGKTEDIELKEDGTVSPISKQGVKVWDSISIDAVEIVAESMYPKNSNAYGATTTLIYGIQWDTALRFIGTYNTGEAGYDTYATNSTGMGNYYGTDGADDIDSTSTPAECGARDGFRQKNIYDMGGNVWEWTMEMAIELDDIRGRIYRGGSFRVSGSACPTSYRTFYNSAFDPSNPRFPCCTLCD